MLDLSFGLPIVVRDAALKMIAPGPQSAVNREFYAQNHEKEIEDGRGGVEAYEKTDEKARELLRRLANSEPYFKKQRSGPSDRDIAEEGPSNALATNGPGPIRTRDSRGGAPARGSGRGGRGGGRGGRAFPSAAQLPPTAQDILPPQDPTIMSFLVTGVEDDLKEYAVRDFFSQYGKLRSLVVTHLTHCAMVNYMSREAAEAAAEACQGRAVIAGCPLRVRWAKPRPIGTLEKDERMAMHREGRAAFAGSGAQGARGGRAQGTIAAAPRDDLESMTAVAAPPGQDDFQYGSLAGE